MISTSPSLSAKVTAPCKLTENSAVTVSGSKARRVIDGVKW